MDVSCPVCKHSPTTKVSAIINAGNAVSETHGVGGGVGSHGFVPVAYRGTSHITTDLARKLAPPNPPQRGVNGAAVAACILGFGFLCCVFAAVGQAQSLMYEYQPPYSIYDDRFAGVWQYGIGALVLLVAVIWCIFQATKAARDSKALYLQKVPRWEHAMGNWQQLYYCSVCDSVYVQSTRQAAPVDEMMHFIFHV